MIAGLGPEKSINLDNWVLDDETSKVEIDILSELTKKPRGMKPNRNALFDLPISMIDADKPETKAHANLRHDINNLKFEYGSIRKHEEKIIASPIKLRPERPIHEEKVKTNIRIPIEQLETDVSFETKIFSPKFRVQNKPIYQFGEKSQNGTPKKAFQRSPKERPSLLFNIGITPRDSSRRGAQRILTDEKKPEHGSQYYFHNGSEPNTPSRSGLNGLNNNHHSIFPKKSDQSIFSPSRKNIFEVESPKGGLKTELEDTVLEHPETKDSSIIGKKESQTSVRKRPKLTLFQPLPEIKHQGSPVSTPKLLENEPTSYFKSYKEKFMANQLKIQLDASPSGAIRSPDSRVADRLDSSKATEINTSHMSPKNRLGLDKLEYFQTGREPTSPLNKIFSFNHTERSRNPAERSILQQAALAQLTNNSSIYTPMSPSNRNQCY